MAEIGSNEKDRFKTVLLATAKLGCDQSFSGATVRWWVAGSNLGGWILQSCDLQDCLVLDAARPAMGRESVQYGHIVIMHGKQSRTCADRSIRGYPKLHTKYS